MSTLKVDLRCPNCSRMAQRQIQYDDLGDPFVHRCVAPGNGCGKYFAVKLNLTLEAECCKVFEGANSGNRDSSGERDES